MVRSLAQHERGSRSGRQDVLLQVRRVDAAPDRPRPCARFVFTQLGEPVEVRLRIRERAALQAEESLEWLGSPTADVVHYRRPNGWEVVTNFGAAPAQLPSGVDLQVLVLSSAAPTAPGGEAVAAEGAVEGMIAGETTLWLAP